MTKPLDSHVVFRRGISTQEAPIRTKKGISLAMKTLNPGALECSEANLRASASAGMTQRLFLFKLAKIQCTRHPTRGQYATD